jgi:hypothetical protein
MVFLYLRWCWDKDGQLHLLLCTRHGDMGKSLD